MKNFSKLIIENRSDLGTMECLKTITEVIKFGRISNNNKQYCYSTRFQIHGKIYFVESVLNKKSDKLIIYNGDNI